jgi:hypothetical protein
VSFPRRNLCRRTALLAVVVGVLAPAGARAQERTYVSTAYCAWNKSRLSVQIAPAPLPPLVETEGSAITSVEPLPEGAGLPWENAYTLATAAAVRRWEQVAHEYAARVPEAAHLANLRLDVTILGPGADPAALPEPDVRIAFVPTMATIGGATVVSCASANSVQNCAPDGSGCILGGTNVLMSTWLVFSFTSNDVYSIVLHEFGHALGFKHVPVPAEDVMTDTYPYSVGNKTNPRQCLSSLNLAQLAESFRWMGGAPFAFVPEPVFLPESQYEQYC